MKSIAGSKDRSRMISGAWDHGFKRVQGRSSELLCSRRI